MWVDHEQCDFLPLDSSTVSTTRIPLPKPSRLRKNLARAEASSLTLRAKELASGWAAGAHRAERKGSGVEFAGHRAYTPGDDLRRLDRHALLRHGRLLIREFLSDTERSVHLIIDASTSMLYRGAGAAEASSKLEVALLLSAALGFIAQNVGDRVGLTTVSETEVFSILPRGGRETFERLLHRLEALDEEARKPPQAIRPTERRPDWGKAFASLGSGLPRGTLIFAFSDFLDAAEGETKALAALATQRRALRAVQILTPEEVAFPFDGSIRLRDLETGTEVETEAASVRGRYMRALADLESSLRREISAQRGQFLRLSTTDSVDISLRQLASGQFDGGGTAR